jgi:hypothetical protein
MQPSCGKLLQLVRQQQQQHTRCPATSVVAKTVNNTVNRAETHSFMPPNDGSDASAATHNRTHTSATQALMRKIQKSNKRQLRKEQCRPLLTPGAVTRKQHAGVTEPTSCYPNIE